MSELIYRQQEQHRAILHEKWKRAIDLKGEDTLDTKGTDMEKRYALAQCYENHLQQLEHDRLNKMQFGMFTEADVPINVGYGGIAKGGEAGDNTGGVAGFDPIMIRMVRRALPKLIAFDVVGVQPMNAPVGLIFAFKSRYGTASGDEALFDEADTDFSGDGTHAGSNPVDGTYTTGTGLSTEKAEKLGATGEDDFDTMALTIEKTSVTAKSRALKSTFSHELAQDIRTVHNMDLEGQLSSLLTEQIVYATNREVIRTLYKTAKPGAQYGTNTAGTFDMDVDANARHLHEKFNGLAFQLARESNTIFHETRRGAGNFIICSSDVATALDTTGNLNHSTDANFWLDKTSTFAGVYNNRFRVYIDPYSSNGSNNQFAVVGYKGAEQIDAGLFYCPYQPLQKHVAQDPNTLAPVIGYKTRYALAANPFVNLDDGVSGEDNLSADKNYYYRRLKITNIT